MLSSQTVFNKSATHLLRQGKKALSVVKTPFTTSEAYHAKYKKNAKEGCALFPFVQKGYKKSIEGLTASDKGVQKVLVANGVNTDRDQELLNDLQNIHDSIDVEEWPANLAVVAKRHGLNMVKTKLNTKANA